MSRYANSYDCRLDLLCADVLVVSRLIRVWRQQVLQPRKLITWESSSVVCGAGRRLAQIDDVRPDESGNTVFFSLKQKHCLGSKGRASRRTAIPALASSIYATVIQLSSQGTISYNDCNRASHFFLSFLFFHFVQEPLPPLLRLGVDLQRAPMVVTECRQPGVYQGHEVPGVETHCHILTLVSGRNPRETNGSKI